MQEGGGREEGEQPKNRCRTYFITSSPAFAQKWAVENREKKRQSKNSTEPVFATICANIWTGFVITNPQITPILYLFSLLNVFAQEVSLILWFSYIYERRGTGFQATFLNDEPVLIARTLKYVRFVQASITEYFYTKKFQFFRIYYMQPVQVIVLLKPVSIWFSECTSICKPCRP